MTRALCYTIPSIILTKGTTTIMKKGMPIIKVYIKYIMTFLS
jgi:hypothetical protein